MYDDVLEMCRSVGSRLDVVSVNLDNQHVLVPKPRAAATVEHRHKVVSEFVALCLSSVSPPFRAEFIKVVPPAVSSAGCACLCECVN